MCKIMTLAGITDSNREQAWQFIKLMVKEMSFSNKDGCGYAAITNEGKLFSEKWVNNDDAFEKREELTPIENSILKDYYPFFLKDVNYKSYGSLEYDKIVAITLHTRAATTPKTLSNTHPFIENDTSLIHNGIIANYEKFKLKQSTCDSEALLRCYIDYNIKDKPQNIQRLANVIDGYYACAVFSKQSNGNVILDVFKDGQASLEAAYINELELIVITTNIKDVEDISRRYNSNINIETKFKISYGKLLRLDAISGKVIKIYSFDPYKVKRKNKREPESTKVQSCLPVKFNSYNDIINEQVDDNKRRNDMVKTTSKIATSVHNLTHTPLRETDWYHDDKGVWRRVNKKK